MDTILSILFIAFFVFLIFGRIWFVPWADRQRVRRHFEERGEEVISITRSHPVFRELLSGAKTTTTFWQVKYRNQDGQMRIAECFASFLRCKVYKDELIPLPM